MKERDHHLNKISKPFLTAPPSHVRQRGTTLESTSTCTSTSSHPHHQHQIQLTCPMTLSSVNAGAAAEEADPRYDPGT